MAEMLRRYVGVPLIEPSDAVRWARLRLAVLEDVVQAVHAAVANGRAAVGYVSEGDASSYSYMDEPAHVGSTLDFDLRN
jgi:hypothetical protein